MQFSTNAIHRSLQFFLLIVLPSCGQALAQNSTPNINEMPGSLEVGVLHHTLTAGNPSWNGQFARGVLVSDTSNAWNASIVNLREFGDSGTMIALGNTHYFDDKWYSSVSASGSSGGSFLPRLRFDVSGSRRWLEGLNLLTTVTLTAINAKDGHQDRSLLLSSAYYFQQPLVLEAGVRINQSNPGKVVSNAKYVAVTYGENKKQIMSLRYGYGQEAYQYIGVDAFLVDFKSDAWTATWRKWIRPQLGFQVRAESYHNQYYDRRGIEVSAFKEF